MSVPPSTPPESAGLLPPQSPDTQSPDTQSPDTQSPDAQSPDTQNAEPHSGQPPSEDAEIPPEAPLTRAGDSALKRWLLGGTGSPDGPGHAAQARHEGQPWWRVMCLTGVDYFSTLGYQPGIAALAAGALSPLATVVLVALTLFGALPVYRRVAAESPNGEGSVSMLERLLGYWPGKVLVLVLLGFLATDFIITITLSAADASAHLIENPFLNPYLHGQQIVVTLFFVLLLGAVFLRGFGEAIWIAVGLVALYLGVNAVVLVKTTASVLAHPEVLGNWRSLLNIQYSSPLAMVGASLLVFPKLALGLSGFETGVAVMPQVQGAPGDTRRNPAGRVRNTRTLLTVAALIMSVFLVVSSLMTTLLIPQADFWPEITSIRHVNADDLRVGAARVNVPLDDPNNPMQSYTLRLSPGASGTFTVQAQLDPQQGGEVVPLQVTVTPGQGSDDPSVLISKPAGPANGRALAYLAHRELGNGFGSLYDVSTILILWFAGASAMAGLVNILPRFLPRYGMAPDWVRANRPLVLIYTFISVIVTLLFRANVDAQGGAYATGVLVLMTSGALAVTLSARRRGERFWPVLGVITLVFVYTTIVNIIERPEGLLIASIFIALILLVSIASRTLRSFELRVRAVELEPSARELLRAFPIRPLRFVAHHPPRSKKESEQLDEYHKKELRARQLAHLPDDAPFIFLEVKVKDASDFGDVIRVQGLMVGEYPVLRVYASSVPNAIAALMLHLRGKGAPPQVYFQWSEASPLHAAVNFLLAGEGDVPPLTHEILRRTEPDRDRRPIIHVGG